LRVWLFVLPLLAAGCAFNNGIAVDFTGSSPVTVIESFSAQVTVRHVSGVSAHAGQVVRIDCPLTVVYDVNEATGSAVLSQTYVVRLRSPRLRRGTRYDVGCSDPIVLELPAVATNVAATATSPSDARTVLPLAAPKGLRADRGTHLVSIGWPQTLPPGDYGLELRFEMPDQRAFREKAIYAATVRCGRRSYLAPLFPAVTNLARVSAFVIDPSSGPSTIILPHIAGANALRATATVRLRC
jgi:hypothetical protein